MVRERRMKENRNIAKQLRRGGQHGLVHEQGKVLELEAAADRWDRVGTEVGGEEEEEEEEEAPTSSTVTCVSVSFSSVTSAFFLPFGRRTTNNAINATLVQKSHRRWRFRVIVAIGIKVSMEVRMSSKRMRKCRDSHSISPPNLNVRKHRNLITARLVNGGSAGSSKWHDNNRRRA